MSAAAKTRGDSSPTNYDRNLQNSRHNAHRMFDLIWKYGFMSRGRAYEWLADQIGWHPGDTHISRMDPETCKQVAKISRAAIEQWHEERVKDNCCAGINPIKKLHLEERMKKQDQWPKELRELAYEEGFGLVNQFVQAGVKRARTIRHLINEVRSERSSFYSNGADNAKWRMGIEDAPHPRNMEGVSSERSS